MKKSFNVNGLCYPDENYMVDLDERMKAIKKLVDNRKYFVINRARQYGKTTTLWALKQYLKEGYIVLSMSFQRLSSAVFQDEHSFSREFANMVIRVIHNKKQKITGLAEDDVQMLEQSVKNDRMNLVDLFHLLSNLCETAGKPVVLIIDYRGRQYVVEMKIWRGEEYNRRGEEQLFDYLEYYHLDKGYLLSFNFNKRKQAGVKEIQCGEKKILEVVV